MSSFLPAAVRQGLEAARAAALRRSGRLCIHDGDAVHRVLRLWDGGFAIAPSDGPPLRGFVELFDGPRRLSRCLIVACGPGGDGERVYEFKAETPAADRPPADFEQGQELPAGLIPRAF